MDSTPRTLEEAIASDYQGLLSEPVAARSVSLGHAWGAIARTVATGPDAAYSDTADSAWRGIDLTGYARVGDSRAYSGEEGSECADRDGSRYNLTAGFTVYE